MSDGSLTPMVAVRDFEGPLGLLLELVERNRLPVTEISVAAVTAQYLERIRGLQAVTPEQLSEFLQLGARLLHIKSLALLPREAAEEQAEELRQLNLELEECRRYQAAARDLARLSNRGSWARPVVSRLAASELPLPELSLAELAAAFQGALKRAEPARPEGIIRRHLTQTEVVARLRSRLSGGPFALQELLDGARDRVEVIVTFLAVLELMREQELRVIQAGQFEPIMVRPAHPAAVSREASHV